MKPYRATAFVTPGSRLELAGPDVEVVSWSQTETTANVACIAVSVVATSSEPLYARVVGVCIGEIALTVEDLDEP